MKQSIPFTTLQPIPSNYTLFCEAVPYYNLKKKPKCSLTHAGRFHARSGVDGITEKTVSRHFVADHARRRGSCNENYRNHKHSKTYCSPLPSIFLFKNRFEIENHLRFPLTKLVFGH